jgi:hypothetical protein
LQQASLLVAPIMAPAQPPPPLAVPEDGPRAYAARISDGGDDDDATTSTCPWWPLRASGVDRDGMKIVRVHVVGMQNPEISEACRLGRSDPMGTSVALILDGHHHVAQPDLMPGFTARDRTALADLPLDGRLKVSLLVRKLITRHATLSLFRQAFLFFPSKHERNPNTSPRHVDAH